MLRRSRGILRSASSPGGGDTWDRCRTTSRRGQSAQGLGTQNKAGVSVLCDARNRFPIRKVIYRVLKKDEYGGLKIRPQISPTDTSL